MTYEEAKALFEEDLKGGKCSDDCPECNARELAISALQKQIPKKPIQANYIVRVNGVATLLDENEFTKCPSCTYKDIEVKHGQKYCHICGQALDWSNAELTEEKKS